MSDDRELLVPRRLAIALLAAAQNAPDGKAAGLVGARDGHPVAIYPAADAAAVLQAERDLAARGQTLWAVFRTDAVEAGPTSGRNPAVPELVVAVGTKGVLQLRCRQPSGGATGHERAVRIET